LRYWRGGLNASGMGIRDVGNGIFFSASCCCIAIGVRDLITRYTNLSAEILGNFIANDDVFSMLDQDLFNSLSGKFFSRRSTEHGVAS
jgi:hypothetical protein